MASFGFAIAATGIFPFKDYLLKDGWQNALAWGTLLFLIYVPVIGIITWIIRRVAKIRSNSRMMRWGFFTLWVVGLVCFISLIVSLSRDFRSLNNVTEENIQLINPSVKMLEVSTNNVGRYNRFNMVPFGTVNDDTAYVNNVSIRIVKSINDSFHVSITKFCNGRTKHYADTLAALITYPVEQRDSTLLIGRGIPITEQDKFRNQHIVLTIAVPVGKRIKINNKVGWDNWERFQFPWTENGEDYDWDDESFSWYNHQGEELVMQADGLYTLDGKPANRSDHKRIIYQKTGPNGMRVIIENKEDDSSDNPGYRYEKTIDSIRVIKEKEIKKVKDSLLKKKEELEKKLEKIDNGGEEAFRRYEKGYDFILSI